MKPGMSLMKHYLQFKDLRGEEYAYLFERTREIKKRFKNYEKYQPLADRTLAMIFEKASTRTRVSFEAGMYQMGGSVVHLTTGDSQLGRAEPVEDSARVISRMVDIVMIRTYEQTKLERFAAHSRVPVINGLTNEYHPCQILADIFTFIEHRGSIQGKTVAWIGDSNNMCNTWLQAAEVLDFNVHVSTPPGYEVEPERDLLRRLERQQLADPRDADRRRRRREVGAERHRQVDRAAGAVRRVGRILLLSRLPGSRACRATWHGGSSLKLLNKILLVSAVILAVLVSVLTVLSALSLRQFSLYTAERHARSRGRGLFRWREQRLAPDGRRGGDAGA